MRIKWGYAFFACVPAAKKCHKTNSLRRPKEINVEFQFPALFVTESALLQ